MSIKTLLNQTCTIKKVSYNQNANTGAQETILTTLYSNVPCRFRTRTLGEYKNSSLEYAKATHSIYIEYKSNLAGNILEVEILGRTFSVIGRINMGGANKLLCLLCKECF